MQPFGRAPVEKEQMYENLPTGVNPDLYASFMLFTSVPCPSAPCQPSTSVHTKGEVSLHSRSRVSVAYMKWIWFHYTLTHGLNNNFELAEHVSSHLHRCYLCNKDQKEMCSGKKAQRMKKNLEWQNSLNTEKKCVQYLSWNYSRNLFWQVTTNMRDWVVMIAELSALLQSETDTSPV